MGERILAPHAEGRERLGGVVSEVLAILGPPGGGGGLPIRREVHELQAKLLKVIEEKSVRRLGGRVVQSLEARVIACTDAGLDAAVRRGAFRADLLQRLKELTLALRPLRERPEDIVPLARYFAGQFAQDHGRVPARLSAGAEERLRCYPWPGNVRELTTVIERAASLCEGEEIDAEQLGLPTP